MELIFSNSKGRIHMDGGDGGAPFKILSAEGLGYVGQSTTVARYPFMGGQRTLERKSGARLITVAADGAKSGKNSEGRLARIAHDSGILEVVDGKKHVYVQSYVSGLSHTRALGQGYERVIFQFTCDYPYFRDVTPTVCSLFKRENFMASRFTLPMTFSGRTSCNTVSVSGDKEVYPRIIIENISAQEETGIAVLNETTGARLELLLPRGEYKKMVLDLWEGRVYSGDTELTHCLTDESYMRDFILAEGENRLKITTMDNEVENSVLVCFENEYYSAWENE